MNVNEDKNSHFIFYLHTNGQSTEIGVNITNLLHSSLCICGYVHVGLGNNVGSGIIVAQWRIQWGKADPPTLVLAIFSKPPFPYSSIHAFAGLVHCIPPAIQNICICHNSLWSHIKWSDSAAILKEPSVVG